jgi:hypothetical protein
LITREQAQALALGDRVYWRNEIHPYEVTKTFTLYQGDTGWYVAVNEVGGERTHADITHFNWKDWHLTPNAKRNPRSQMTIP